MHQLNIPFLQQLGRDGPTKTSASRKSSRKPPVSFFRFVFEARSFHAGYLATASSVNDAVLVHARHRCASNRSGSFFCNR